MADLTYIQVTDKELADLISNHAAITDAFYIVPSGIVYQGLKTGGTQLYKAASVDLNVSVLTTKGVIAISDISTSILPDVVTAGTFGDNTNIPQITIDIKGRVVAIVNVPIPTAYAPILMLMGG